MKRGLFVLGLCIMAVAAYFTADKWGIRHVTLSSADILRENRNVTVQVAVRRDREIQSMAEMIDLPVAILSHGNTVKHTEYSFLSNVFAARGYLVISIQHDLSSDDPMVTKVGEEYVGRRLQYNRGIANIMFALDELKKVQPNADYRHLVMVGHSNGGDISMYFAKRYSHLIKKVVTLDNLRVPFITDGKFKILSFRSKDPVFKPDPGVIPDDDVCAKAGITVVRTEFQHNELSDRGPDHVKTHIQAMLDKFLADESTPDPAQANKPNATEPEQVALSGAAKN
jgi:pimeloyl-ACP methyl ester carboxylesterase